MHSAAGSRHSWGYPTVYPSPELRWVTERVRYGCQADETGKLLANAVSPDGENRTIRAAFSSVTQPISSDAGSGSEVETAPLTMFGKGGCAPPQPSKSMT